jgi:cell volume regulation protein A
MNVESTILVFAILLFIAILVGKVGSRFGVPLLLLFMGVGMLAGSEGYGIQFENFDYANSI